MLRITILTVSLLFAMLLAAAAGLPSSGRPALAQSCDWTGVWLPFEGEWRLAQNGTSVSGSYLNGKGLVSGTVDGDVLRGEWKEPPTYSPPFEAGHFTVTMTADCSGFVGTWGLGDADCCNDLSAIRDGDPPPSLAVQVESGTLVVDGQTIPAGATYFPPSCPPPGRSAAGRSPTESCAAFVLEGADKATQLKFSCFIGQILRVLVVLDRIGVDEDVSDLLVDIVSVRLREKCGISSLRQDDWALDLAVRQGAAHFAAAVEGQMISVEAGPATSNLHGPGSFLAGYDPTAGKATFQAYSAPLDVQPQSGAAFILPPYSRVEVTAGGPGPVTSLSRLYLPMQER